MKDAGMARSECSNDFWKMMGVLGAFRVFAVLTGSPHM
jgi:hypothetical protein